VQTSRSFCATGHDLFERPSVIEDRIVILTIQVRLWRPNSRMTAVACPINISCLVLATQGSDDQSEM